MRAFVVLLLLTPFYVSALYLGGLDTPRGWLISEPENDSIVHFFVGLKTKLSMIQIQAELLAVSTPKSSHYGKHWSLERVRNEVYANEDIKDLIVSWLNRSLGESAQIDPSGAFIQVKSSVSDCERAFGTKMHLFRHASSGKLGLRATTKLNIPPEFSEHITFFSLNAPIMAAKTSALKTHAEAQAAAASPVLKVTAGNNEALVGPFVAYCSDGLVNQQSPPCKGEKLIPAFTAISHAFANNRSDPFSLDSDPEVIEIAHNTIACLNTFTKKTCSGQDANNCTCYAKVAPLPKYTQLTLQLYETPVQNKTKSLGNSSYFALTDVATPDMLGALYSIPRGLSVKHGSTQACVEFYGNQYFSTNDLTQYLALVGLADNPILPENCFGSLPYNASKEAGGEAQLDVELLQGLAPGAKTSFYNYDEANPYSSENEGFLSFCQTVSQQTNPPLVFSVSYGDNEATVFNSSEPGSWEYGMAVDQQFAIMGLRGLTVLFSSGDDGLGSTLIRSSATYSKACSQAWPEWPASSPYVTAVGATMMTDKPLPLCGQPYYDPISQTLPPSSYLLAQCSTPGETVCSSSFGGIITSGGGFSNVYNRQGTAPWQEASVAAYLKQSGKTPPQGYFNSTGRGYPDVSTYGSNFFVYLNGEIVRESGTSGSAPVMAAMVTLWNDMRLAYNLPPLGFINPFLYDVAASHPDAFQDIVTGNNACGAGGFLTTSSCCKESFSAAVGWDASTGLGSPNFKTIANLVVNQAYLFPSTESATAAIPTASPTASPVMMPTSSTSTDSSTSNGSYASASTATVAGFALFFGVTNTLALAYCGYYFLYKLKNRPAVGPLIQDHQEEDKIFRHSGLYNPLTSSHGANQ